MKTKAEIIEYLKKNYKPVEPGKSFTVQPFSPEDAMGVIQCCWSIYGDGYPVDTYYTPEKLIQANSDGTIYGLVAKTADGEIIGYGALYRSSPPFKGIYEAGQYIIQKEYRGSRAAYNINQRLIEYARELGIDAIYGETVTHHLITQKFGARAGTLGTALEIDLMPAEAYDNDERVSGRVTTLLEFLIYNDKPQQLFIDEGIREHIEKSVIKLKVEREIISDIPDCQKAGSTIINTEEYDFAGVGRAHISATGDDFEYLFEQYESRIFGKNYKVSQVFLSSSDSGSIRIYNYLKLKGYFYGGYLPRWTDSDAILMQKLVVPPTFEGINLFTEDAKWLLEYVKTEYNKHVNKSDN